MGFFDKVKETASAVGDKVKETSVAIGDKSKVAIEKQKVKAAIAKENQNITRQYTEIGKKYVEVFGEHPSLEFADSIKAINTAKEEITKLTAQLGDLEDYVTCQCGAKVPKNSAFCPTCGNQVVVATTTAEEVSTTSTEAEEVEVEEVEPSTTEE